MTPRPSPSPSGPTTHYDLFAGLLAAEVAFLVTGAVALVLHGVPRLTPDIDLAADPDEENLARLTRLLASWGYGRSGEEPVPAGAAAVWRFRHPTAALEEIDIVLPAPEEYAQLRAGAAIATLVDVGIPVVGARELRAIKERAHSTAGGEDAAALDALAAIQAGEPVEESDTRREQIRKFSRWSVAARLDWLLASARLARGLAPESRPLTRGLVRRGGWYGRR